MKNVKSTGKLSLNKQTVTKLNDQQMNQVLGGKPWWSFDTICHSMAESCLCGTSSSNII